MAWQTSAGSTFAIATTPGAPSTSDVAGYAAKTYTVVGEVTQIGEFGREYATVTHQPLATRGVKKGKGSYNNGALNPSLALDESDAGQILMRTALASDESYAFRVTLQNGAKYYIMGKVMSFKINVGGVDDTVTASPAIEIDSDSMIPDLAA